MGTTCVTWMDKLVMIDEHISLVGGVFSVVHIVWTRFSV